MKRDRRGAAVQRRKFTFQASPFCEQRHEQDKQTVHVSESGEGSKKKKILCLYRSTVIKRGQALSKHMRA